MAIFYGEDKYLIDQKRIRREKVFNCLYKYLIFAAVVLVLTWTYVIHRPVTWIFIFSIIVFSVIFLFDKLFYKKRHSFFIAKSGLSGEYAVRNELTKLDNSYHVFQNVCPDENKTNIDFVVAGPIGVFTIEVKNERVSITNPDQINKDQLSQSRQEALRLHDYLEKTFGYVFVYPILVYSRENSMVTLGNEAVENVFVIQKRWLIKTITQREKGEINPAVIDLLKKLGNKQKNI